MFNDENGTFTKWLTTGVSAIIAALGSAIIYLHKMVKSQMAEEIAETKRELQESRRREQELTEERNLLAVENAMLKARYGEDTA